MSEQRELGPWRTLGLGFLIIILYSLFQVLIIGVFGFEEAEQGLAVALATIISAPFGIGLTFIAIQRQGYPIREYLDFTGVSKKEYGKWTFIAVLVIIGFYILDHILNRPIPSVLIETYRTSVYPPLLWLAVVVMAPFFEEIFFRGFLYKGLSRMRSKEMGAVLLTALLWAVIHTQYETYEIMQVFVLGLVLGLSRWKSKSIYPPLFLHFMVNLIATIQIELIL